MSRTKKAARKQGKSQKRKAEDDSEEPPAKAQKVSEKPEARTKTPHQGEPAQHRSVSHDESIAKRDPALLADFFAQKVAKHYGDTTIIEQQDIGIARDWILDTTEFDQPHIAENLPAYLDKFVEGGRDALTTVDADGTPKALIISPSGIRVADVVRELREYTTATSKVGKLIAKHQKLKENIDYLSKTKTGIVVSTPARFRDLVNHGALKTSSLVAVVIDASYQDEKRRMLTDMAEIFKQLIEFLGQDSIKTRLDDSHGATLLVF
ncbi:uncharacterized protein HMPREF1541_03349 [Cyphellophora europaea CBS 101466]|uniref:Uncharacterized protein n=1 Tax=Cyphellophora europaea (strain CBS 101466) TaxID=1220924 RepID=W2S0G3_CYPE1|nr:uncharacterized protein HMPREF1541_03349 [Cyphellophora europaea CBS 101466]ETN41414.1 hypothetical protein HMPREF1541_03349 [Cyphellophora europaea CBS 101466]